MARIFINYRRSETRHVAGRLRDRLGEHFGSPNVDLDIDMIGAGVDYVSAIERAITSCQVLVALVGPGWTVEADRQGRRLDNPHDPVVGEIRTALGKGIRVIPVLIDGATMPHEEDLPTAIQAFSRLNALRLDHETFRTDTELLVVGIEQALAEAGSSNDFSRPYGTPPAAGLAQRASDHRVSVWPPWGLRDAAPVRGRDELVGDLINHVGSGSAGKRVWVLHGLGGVGKTRVALEVAFQAKRANAHVWWVSATDMTEFVPGMYAVAELVGVDLDRLHHVSPADALWAALAVREERWLLVIDNADDPGTVLTTPGHTIGDGTSWVRSATSRGLVLITSRNGSPAVWGGGVVLRPITALPSSAGGQILVDLAPASGSVEDAETLAHRLGGLPLALHLAGSALAEVSAIPPILVGDGGLPCTFAQYGHALDEQFTSLFPPTSEEVAADPHQARQLVGQTWQISLTQLSASGFPDARPLLRLLACFGDASIPYGLLLKPSILAASPLFPGITGRRLWDVLQALDGLNLITLGSGQTADPSSFTASLHPLVRETNAAPCRPQRPLRVHDLGCPPHRGVGREPRKRVGRLPRGMAAMAGTGATRHPRPPSTGGREWMRRRRCRRGMPRSNARRALPLQHRPVQAGRERAAVGAERRLSPPRRAASRGAGHPPPARPGPARPRPPRAAAAELRIVLEARRRTSGEDHPGTLATRNQLAWTLRAQGLHDDAECELEAIIEAKTRVLGGEHPDTLVARMDLAQVRHEQGHHERAAAEYADVLAARRRILGDDHPKTLNTRQDLAQLWYDQGQFAEAASAYSEVLAARRRVLGDDHPKTLATRHNLAITLDKLGQRADAAGELREVLDTRRRVLGEDHPDTLASAESLRRVRS